MAWNPDAEYAKKRLKGKKGSKKPNCSFSKPWMAEVNKKPEKRDKIAANHAVYKESGIFYLDDKYKEKMSKALKNTRAKQTQEERDAWKARMDEAQNVKRYGKNYKKTLFFQEDEEFWD